MTQGGELGRTGHRQVEALTTEVTLTSEGLTHPLPAKHFCYDPTEMLLYSQPSCGCRVYVSTNNMIMNSAM